MNNFNEVDVSEVKEAHRNIKWTVDILPQQTVEGFLETNTAYEQTNFVIGDESLNEEVEGLKEAGVEAIRYRILDKNGEKQGGDYNYLVVDRDWNKQIENHMEDIKWDQEIKKTGDKQIDQIVEGHNKFQEQLKQL